MKTKNLFLVPALIAVLNFIPAGRVTAQTFTTLHSFTATPYPPYANNDGAIPAGGLILSGQTLYGTAADGGSSGFGTVFKVNTDGTGFATLHIFTAFDQPYGPNSDGANPFGGLILSGNTLYGTAANGGSSGAGTVFKVNTDGTVFTTLHSFTARSVSPPYINSGGAYPYCRLVLSGNTLYGTAGLGGSSGAGTLFKGNTDGTGFANLYSFTGGSDGANPQAGLIRSGNTLYGTAINGGSSGHGTVFKVNTDGASFTNLYSFTATSGTLSANSDGVTPSGLILSGNTLYGTANTGGNSGRGTVFKVNFDGTGFTTLHSFTALSAPDYRNSDGAHPQAGLILSGNTLYGTAANGGSSGAGTVFAVNTNGTGFTNLHDFNGSGDGAGPLASLILSGNTLYGTTMQGGSSGNGTVFSLSLPPPVARCKRVTVSADVSCRADASIDDGSFDATGGTITLVQFPSGPYPLGDTSVTLTVTDSHGASNSCAATVTVVDTAPPVITCPGSIATDATSSAGAAVSFAPTASDNCSLASVTSSPPSGTTFPIGDTTVSCAGTDAAGNQAACTFTVHVKGAAEQIRSNIALVQRLGLQSGTANSLIVKLQGAASALERGNLEAACGNLGAFLSEVNAQTGRKLTAAQADSLIAEATRIRAVLGCR